MKILVDLDDVLELLSVRWVDEIAKRYGIRKTRDEITSWDVCKTFPELTRDQIYNPLIEPGFWEEIEPMPGAKEVLLEMIERGHEIFVVTSSYYKNLNEKIERALFNLYPFLTWDHVIVTSHKEMVVGDVLIDDNAQNLTSEMCIKVLFDAPWNRDVNTNSRGIIRVHNWEEIRDILISIETKRASGVGVKMRDKEKRSE